MSLSNITLPKQSIEGSGGSFEVTGLSLEQVVKVTKKHFGDAKEFASSGEFNLALLAARSPDFTAEIIATAAGEPEHEGNVRQLTIGTQTRALRAIWNLSVEDEEEFYNTVIAALDGFNGFTDRLEKSENPAGKRIAQGMKQAGDPAGK